MFLEIEGSILAKQSSNDREEDAVYHETKSFFLMSRIDRLYFLESPLKKGNVSTKPGRLISLDKEYSITVELYDAPSTTIFFKDKDQYNSQINFVKKQMERFNRAAVKNGMYTP